MTKTGTTIESASESTSRDRLLTNEAGNLANECLYHVA
jgi:hypothetical protein